MALILSAGLLSFGTGLRAEESRHSEIAGENVLDTGKVKLVTSEAKATVVVFLSANCPCSNSHVKELAALAQENPQVRFIGVHSNVNESHDTAKSYFKQVQLPFPVIEDPKAQLADEFRALKTPHAFVMNANGEVIYRGGVSNSHDVNRADRKYLREALDDIKKGAKIRTSEGRALGCAILRS
jgi:thioredoxin-related protein